MLPFENLFPLPLSSFEHYLLLDDTSTHPMTFSLALNFSGEIDRGLWDQAVAAALAGQPLLRAKVERRRGGPVWIYQGRSDPQTRWVESEQDLTSGLRLSVLSGPSWDLQGTVHRGRSLVLARFHHVVCDATGALEFLGDILWHYHQLITGEGTARQRTINPERLHLRGLPAPAPSTARWGRIQDMIGMAREAWQILGRRSLPMAPPKPNRNNDSTSGNQTVQATAGIPHLSLAVGPLRQAARALNVQVNDLLLTALFQTLAVWHCAASGPAPRDWMRVVMPTDLRKGERIADPAANVVGYAFLTRRCQDCLDPYRMVQSLSTETRTIRERSLGACFTSILGCLQSAPVILPTYLKYSRSFATSVLSNLGVVSRRFAVELPMPAGQIVAGNLTLKEVSGIPPIRRGTGAALMALEYAGEQRLCIQADPEILTEPQSLRLLQDFACHLEELTTFGPAEG